jgi:CheY-like chemotaxis protein
MSSSLTGSPANVLVVEDEMVLRMRAVDIVEDAGFRAVEAVNADEAISILEARSDISLLFTNIQMPGSMDSLKLAHAVHDRWPAIKIILVSGQVNPLTRRFTRLKPLILKAQPLCRTRSQWRINLDCYAFWRVGAHDDGSVDLRDQALDYLEAQARPGLVNVEILRKADPPVRHLHVQIVNAPFARDLDFARSFGVGMLGGIRNKLVDQKT